MSGVEELLHEFIAEHRSSGRVDARRYLDQVSGADRLELATHIDRYLADAPGRPFDAQAFARYRADPARQARVERILDDTTLEELRKQARVSKTQAGQALAVGLELPGRERLVKARYHDLEQGSVDPARVRRRVWELLADLFGVQVDRLRSAAESRFGGGLGDLSSAVYARTAASAGVFAEMASPAAPSPDEDEVDRAFFED